MLSLARVFDGKEQYKVITAQNALNQLIDEHVLPRAQGLRRLKLLITDKLLHIRGVVFQPDIKTTKTLKAGDIFFDLTLIKEEIRKDEVYLDIKKFKIYNPKRRVDIWRFIDKYSTTIRKKIMLGLTGPSSPFFEIDPLKKLCFDLKFVLNKIPTEVSLLGEIGIRNVGLERRQLVWYIESNFVLKSVIDYLGPRNLLVEKVDENQDALRLLTDFQFETDE